MKQQTSTAAIEETNRNNGCNKSWKFKTGLEEAQCIISERKYHKWKVK